MEVSLYFGIRDFGVRDFGVYGGMIARGIVMDWRRMVRDQAINCPSNSGAADDEKSGVYLIGYGSQLRWGKFIRIAAIMFLLSDTANFYIYRLSSTRAKGVRSTYSWFSSPFITVVFVRYQCKCRVEQEESSQLQCSAESQCGREVRSSHGISQPLAMFSYEKLTS